MNQITPSLTLLGRDTAYTRIRELIVSGALPPGAPVSERGLSENLGIGRTPVREAVKALAREGLLEIVPMRGTFVRQLSVDDLREIHETRLALEGMAAYLAAERGVTDELRRCAAELEALAHAEPLDVDVAQRVGWAFHEAMFRATGNRRLLVLYGDLRAQNGLALQKIEHYDVQRTHDAVREHLRIFKAIEAGDASGAQREVWAHLTQAMQARLSVLAPGRHTA